MATTLEGARRAGLLLNVLLLVGCAAPTAIPSTVPTSQPTFTVTAAPTRVVTATPSPTLTETPTTTPSPLPTRIPQWSPGWLVYEDADHPYTVAYPRAWSVQVNKWRWGEVTFQSPESHSTIYITVFYPGTQAGSPEWVTWVEENVSRFFPSGHPDGSPYPDPEINTRFLDRDAIFLFESGRPHLGTQASLLFPEGENVYWISLSAGWLEAEGSIYRTMLTTFTLNGERDPDYSVPEGVWADHYSAVERVSGSVFQVVAEERLIVLQSPVFGFVTVTLEPDGALVNLEGEAMAWGDILPGMRFEAQGRAGDVAGNYLAEHIVVQIRR